MTASSTSRPSRGVISGRGAMVAIALILLSASPARSLEPSIEHRLILGEDVNPAEVPLWHAYLEIVTPKSTFRCGGGLMSPNHILTAAHCVIQDPPATEVRVFSNGVRDYRNRFSKWTSQKHSRVVPIGKWMVHGEYSNKDWAHDLAVGYTDVPFDLPAGFRFPKPVYDSEIWNRKVRNQESEWLHVHGFGWEEDRRTPDAMERVHLNAVSHADCARAWGSYIHAGDLCAIGDCEQTQQYGLLCQDSCRGDSGGLLVHMPDGPNESPSVYGVVSRGSTNCGTRSTTPGIYSSLSLHQSFVRTALSGQLIPGDDARPVSPTGSSAPRAALWLALLLTCLNIA